MTVLAAAAPFCYTLAARHPCLAHAHAQGGSIHWTLVPHAGNVLTAALMVAVLAIACWRELRRSDRR